MLQEEKVYTKYTLMKDILSSRTLTGVIEYCSITDH